MFVEGQCLLQSHSTRRHTHQCSNSYFMHSYEKYTQDTDADTRMRNIHKPQTQTQTQTYIVAPRFDDLLRTSAWSALKKDFDQIQLPPDCECLLHEAVALCRFVRNPNMLYDAHRRGVLRASMEALKQVAGEASTSRKKPSSL